jgi:hypothetical protein
MCKRVVALDRIGSLPDLAATNLAISVGLVSGGGELILKCVQPGCTTRDRSRRFPIRSVGWIKGCAIKSIGMHKPGGCRAQFALDFYPSLAAINVAIIVGLGLGRQATNTQVYAPRVHNRCTAPRAPLGSCNDLVRDPVLLLPVPEQLNPTTEAYARTPDAPKVQLRATSGSIPIPGGIYPPRTWFCPSSEGPPVQSSI